jgi:hypothetical protein
VSTAEDQSDQSSMPEFAGAQRFIRGVFSLRCRLSPAPLGHYGDLHFLCAVRNPAGRRGMPADENLRHLALSREVGDRLGQSFPVRIVVSMWRLRANPRCFSIALFRSAVRSEFCATYTARHSALR